MDKKVTFDNDLELLSKIREHDELALEAMFEKYKPLIYTKIKKYHFPRVEKEDYLQEGRIVLVKAIDTYRDDHDKNKSFTKYFELLLENRFISLYRSNKNQLVLINVDDIDIAEPIEEKEQFDYQLGNLSKTEKKVFELYFKENYAIKDISKALNLNEKQIYNAIQRIKKKQILKK